MNGKIGRFRGGGKKSDELLQQARGQKSRLSAKQSGRESLEGGGR